jgi:tetrahydromethanopterin S-methyltransferase subunit B
MYEKMGIKSDIQIKESDITSLINASSENDLRLKITNIEEKFEKVQAHIEDIKAKIEAKHQTDVKELLSLKSKEQEKQIEVLKFMKDSGFDLIPKEISDKFIRDIQANTLQIP